MLDRAPDANSRLAPIVALFDCVDPQAIDCINGFCAVSTGGCPFDAYKVIVMHMQLDAVKSNDEGLHIQKADFVLSRVFLHTKIWQASVSHSILAFGTPFIELQPEYPLAMLVRAVEGTRRFSRDSLTGNGQCMVSAAGSKLM